MWKRILCTLTAVLCLAAAPLAVQGDEMPQGISSMSAVLMELETGKVLYAKDAHTPKRRRYPRGRYGRGVLARSAGGR